MLADSYLFSRFQAHLAGTYPGEVTILDTHVRLLASLLGLKVTTMDRDLEKLREEVSALEGLIESRKRELEGELTRHSDRYNRLLRLPTSDDEIIREHDTVESLKKDLDSLNELRQVLVLKRALLGKLERDAD